MLSREREVVEAVQVQEILPGQQYIYFLWQFWKSSLHFGENSPRQDGNGKLDYDEFVKMMLQYWNHCFTLFDRYFNITFKH